MPILPLSGSATYCPNDAITLVGAYGHGIPLNAVKANLCDIVNSIIWTYYPWSWSLSSLTAITLVDQTQDYSPTDTNIIRPIRIRIVRTDITPNEFRELDILDNVAPDLSWNIGLENCQCVGWLAGQNIFRLRAAAGITSPITLELQGEYQRQPTKITESNLAIPFSFYDHFYDPFIELLKWKIYQLNDDARAGSLVADKRGNVTYTGQLGIGMAMLQQMAAIEDLSNGNMFQFPSQPIGVSRSATPGLFF